MEHARWARSAVAVRGINLGDVKEIPILMPKPASIAEFAQFARKTFDMQSAQLRAADEADALFNSLVHRRTYVLQPHDLDEINPL